MPADPPGDAPSAGSARASITAPLLVFVAGPGRSGSTLTDLLLNNHPDVQSLGEIHRLNLYARTNPEPCTCGRPVSECPFWLSVEAALRRRLGSAPDAPLLRDHEMMLEPSKVGPIASLVQKALLIQGSRTLYRTLLPLVAPAHRRAASNSLDWYDAVREVTGCPVVVDSTKDPRRLKTLFFADPDRFRCLYMIRDGRAITASRIRREGCSMEYAARNWVAYHQRTRHALRGIPRRLVHEVRYEALCRDPSGTMREVFRFLGLPFDESMLELRKDEAHNIGGNPMRFRSGETGIRIDEQWRQQLSTDDLQSFDRVAGRWNRDLGYRD